MAVKSIRENADSALLSVLSQYSQMPNAGALLCRFSLSPQPIQSDAVLAATASLIGNYAGEIYFCSNRDVLVLWQGPLAQISANLKNLIRGHFRGIVTKIGETNFFQFFDLRDQSASLRSFLSAVPVPLEDTLAKPADGAIPLVFTPDQLAQMKQGVRDRNSKRGFEAMGLNILIVEDQEFSLKLLSNLLSRDHSCVTANSAAQMLELYPKHVPDILYLDVELPDGNGHDIAAFVKQHDPECYIIMVTANTDLHDVQQAKKNGVRGYITKPFRQQKIQASVDAYVKQYNH